MRLSNLPNKILRYLLVFAILAILVNTLSIAVFAYEYKDNPSDYTRCTGTCTGGDPGGCANGGTIGDGHCGSVCDGGKTWTKYDSDCELQKYDIDGEEVCRWIRVQGGEVFSTGDKCMSGDKGLRPGYCDGGTGSSIYKTCCNGDHFMVRVSRKAPAVQIPKCQVRD